MAHCTNAMKEAISTDPVGISRKIHKECNLYRWRWVMNRTIRYFVTGFLVINALLFSGCGSDSGSNEKIQSTGDISLSLVWNMPSIGKAPLAQRALDVVFDQEGRIDCDESGISTIYVRIYDQTSGELVKDNGEGWQCSDHSGVIKKVTIGNRKLVCLAYDDHDNVIYRGQQLDVLVSAADTSTVQIAMEPFASEPSGLDDGARIYENTLEIECTPVLYAAQYRLQVATDKNFDVIILDETSPTPAFKSSPLSTINTYYWRICAVDMHGSQGAWSTTRTVDVALPPTVSTDPATNISPTAAVLNGTVTPTVNLFYSRQAHIFENFSTCAIDICWIVGGVERP